MEQVSENLVVLLVPLFFFLFLGAVILVPRILKSMERQALMDTARKVLERDGTLPPELMEALKPDERPPTADRDLRRGAILVAVALALIVFSFTDGDRDFIAIAAFPGFIGLVHLGFWAANRNKPSA